MENDQPLASTCTKRLLFNEVGGFMRLLWGSSHVLLCSLFRQVLTMEPWLAWNSERSACLCLWNAGIIGYTTSSGLVSALCQLGVYLLYAFSVCHNSQW